MNALFPLSKSEKMADSSKLEGSKQIKAASNSDAKFFLDPVVSVFVHTDSSTNPFLPELQDEDHDTIFSNASNAAFHAGENKAPLNAEGDHKTDINIAETSINVECTVLNSNGNGEFDPPGTATEELTGSDGESAVDDRHITTPIDNGDQERMIVTETQKAVSPSVITRCRVPISAKFRTFHLIKKRSKSKKPSSKGSNDGAALIKYTGTPFLSTTHGLKKSIREARENLKDFTVRCKSTTFSSIGSAKIKLSSFVKNFNGKKSTQVEDHTVSRVSFSEKFSLDYPVGASDNKRFRSCSASKPPKTSVAPIPEVSDGISEINVGRQRAGDVHDSTVDSTQKRMMIRENNGEESGRLELWKTKILMGKKCRPLDLDNDDEINCYYLKNDGAGGVDRCSSSTIFPTSLCINYNASELPMNALSLGNGSAPSITSPEDNDDTQEEAAVPVASI